MLSGCLMGMNFKLNLEQEHICRAKQRLESLQLFEFQKRPVTWGTGPRQYPIVDGYGLPQGPLLSPGGL